MNNQDLYFSTKTVQPIHEFIIKIATPCNINCNYCYEYNLGDDTWKDKSKIISLDTAKMVAKRISEHAHEYSLENIFISFHGGEPLLASPTHIDNLATIFKKEILLLGIKLDITIQSNCILINDEYIDVFKKHNILVGVSIDGNQTHNDLHRLDHLGNSTYSDSMRGINLLLSKAPNNIAGLLAVIDISTNPIEVFDALAEIGIQDVDFLLPHYHYDSLPPRINNIPTEYGEWYYTIWKEWLGGRHQHLRIRFLDNLVARLIGKEGLYEQMTESPACMIVIDADGNLEGVDTLKSTASGVQNLNINLREDPFSKALDDDTYIFRQNPIDNLAEKCRMCTHKSICVGGYLPHRYSAKNAFDNPSIYCNDLIYLIDNIKKDLMHAVSK